VFTIYAFSGARQAIWEDKAPQIFAAVRNNSHGELSATGNRRWFPGVGAVSSYRTRIGIWNYSANFGDSFASALHPAGLFGAYFAPSFVLWPTTSNFPAEIWWFEHQATRGMHLLIVATFATASLYCNIIHKKSRKSGILPLDNDIKLCK